MSGDHPGLAEGSVGRTVCVGGDTGDCEYEDTTSVRACPDTR